MRVRRLLRTSTTVVAVWAAASLFTLASLLLLASEQLGSQPGQANNNSTANANQLQHIRLLKAALQCQNGTQPAQPWPTPLAWLNTTGQWRRLSDELLVFSGFVDARGSHMQLRLMALWKSRAANRHAALSQLGAALWCIDPTTLDKVAVTAYEMCENHNAIYGGYVLSCNWTGRQPPMHVYLQHDDVHSAVQVDVVQPMNDEQQPARQYVICVHSPLHASRYNVQYVAEYIELQLALGATHLVFYVTDDQQIRSLRQLLRLYASLGVVSVVDWPIDSVLGASRVWYLGQLVAVQDCLYRALAAGVTFLAMHDLDEVIVPRLPDANSLPQLAARLWTWAPTASGFQIAPELHRASAVSLFNSTGTGYLPTNNSFARSLTKTIVRPERVFELGIHHISKPIDERWRSVLATTQHAVMQHYTNRSIPVEHLHSSMDVGVKSFNAASLKATTDNAGIRRVLELRRTVVDHANVVMQYLEAVTPRHQL